MRIVTDPLAALAKSEEKMAINRLGFDRKQARSTFFLAVLQQSESSQAGHGLKLRFTASWT